MFFSNDAVSVAVLVVGIAVLALSAPAAGRRIQAFFRLCISMAGAGENQAFSDGGALLKAFLEALVWCAGPLLGATAVAGVAATFAQTKMLVPERPCGPNSAGLIPSGAFSGCFPCAAWWRQARAC